MKIAWVYLDKKSASVDALKDFSSMEYIISNSPADMFDIQSRMTAVRSSAPNGMPHQPNPQAAESRIAASIDEIDVLKERYRGALEYMEWFRPAWIGVSDDDKFVLKEFYLTDGDTVGAICNRFHIERSSAYNKKNRALEKLALLLYGK
ncbi:hypothetical protein FACS1894219_12800 [Clostridia bacterium]|nr:hypothetical protein FACS1894219_12800 [Clostridia bacterium]